MARGKRIDPSILREIETVTGREKTVVIKPFDKTVNEFIDYCTIKGLSVMVCRIYQIQ